MKYQDIFNINDCARDVLRVFIYVEVKEVKRLVTFLQENFDKNNLQYKDEYNFQNKLKNILKFDKCVYLIISKYAMDDYISFLSIIEVDKLKSILDRKLGKYDYKFVLAHDLYKPSTNKPYFRIGGGRREIS